MILAGRRDPARATNKQTELLTVTRLTARRDRAQIPPNYNHQATEEGRPQFDKATIPVKAALHLHKEDHQPFLWKKVCGSHPIQVSQKHRDDLKPISKKGQTTGCFLISIENKPN